MALKITISTAFVTPSRHDSSDKQQCQCSRFATMKRQLWRDVAVVVVAISDENPLERSGGGAGGALGGMETG